ncbi:hypothetical protein MPSEU_000343500 [Mayamaea pseudoterrestris]|nr:hypothetical protein MPSEU_000343500 [Mayamaea pseudoterrestris]
MDDLHALIYGSQNDAASQGDGDDQQQEECEQPLLVSSSPQKGNADGDKKRKHNDNDSNQQQPKQRGRKRKSLESNDNNENEAAAVTASAVQRMTNHVPMLLQTLYPKSSSSFIHTTATTTTDTVTLNSNSSHIHNIYAQNAPPPVAPPPLSDAALQRRKRKERRFAIKRQWQLRKYNLTSERDVGGACERAMRNAIATRNEGANANAIDASTNSNDEHAAANATIIDDAEQDYWQLGRTMPARVDITYRSLPPIAPLQSVVEETMVEETKVVPDATKSVYVNDNDDANDNEDNDDENDELDDTESFANIPIPVLKLSSFSNVSQFKSSKALRNDYNHGTFCYWPNHRMQQQEQVVATRPLHRRLLHATAARAVMAKTGGAAAEAKVTFDNDLHDRLINRLLVLLWKHPPLKTKDMSLLSAHHVDRSTLVQHQTECAANHCQFYLQHFAEWSSSNGGNHVKVMRELGLASRYGVATPPSLVGYPLGNRKKLNVAHDRLQQRLLQQYGVSKKAMTIANSNNIDADTTEHGINGFSILAPTVSYYFVPGSVPPTPMGPLLPINIVFGPMDKYNYTQHHAPISESVYKTTLAALLPRYAAARIDDDDDEVAAARSVQQHIHCVALETALLNQNNRWTYYTHFGSKSHLTELPLPQFAKAAEFYCSLVASNVIPALSTSYSCDNGDDQDSHRDEYKLNTVEGRKRWSESFFRAGEPTPSVFELVEQWKDHNGLQMFSHLQVIFGLFRVAHILPDAAAEIFSRPLSDAECTQTPMERMQQVLEFMESSHMLTGVEVPLQGQEHNVIHVSELEYALHHAADCFAKAIERDPVEPSHYAWYLAVSAGSLLLCSGNRIGSEARLWPSYRVTDSSQQSVFGSLHDSSSVAAHEVRRKLPKFDVLRQQTARAVQLLVTLADQQQGTRSNLLVASFLEWRQVIAFLVGPEGSDGADFVTIRSLHQHYVAQYAIHENSSKSLEYLLAQPSLGKENEKLDGLALALERDPSNVDHWINLSDALGPIVDVSSKPTTWWGQDRKDWWDDALLRVPKSTASTIVNDAEIMQRACSVWQPPIMNEANTSDQLTIDNDDDKLGAAGWTWLERVINSTVESTKDDKKAPPMRRRKRVYDNNLPLPHRLAMLDETVLDTKESMLRSLTLDDDAMLVLCCKLILRCHLYGATDADLVRLIGELVMEAWNDALGMRNLELDACKVLECLHQLGFDIAALSKTNIVDNKQVDMTDANDSLQSSIHSKGRSSSSSSDDSSTSSTSSTAPVESLTSSSATMSKTNVKDNKLVDINDAKDSLGRSLSSKGRSSSSSDDSSTSSTSSTAPAEPSTNSSAAMSKTNVLDNNMVDMTDANDSLQSIIHSKGQSSSSSSDDSSTNSTSSTASDESSTTSSSSSAALSKTSVVDGKQVDMSDADDSLQNSIHSKGRSSSSSDDSSTSSASSTASDKSSTTSSSSTAASSIHSKSRSSSSSDNSSTSSTSSTDSDESSTSSL